MASQIYIALVVLLATCASANVVARREPPEPTMSALMARYIVNEAEWASIASVSVRDNTKNYPFVNLVSLSDGPKGNGSGVPYIFLIPLDFTGQDLQKDQRVTMMMSLVQGNWCDEKGYDPQDPRCGRVFLSGKMEQILENHPEYPVAQKAFYGRHAWLAHIPKNHHGYLAKLNIETVSVLAHFGRVAQVTVEDYYAANQTTDVNYAATQV